MDVLSDDVVFKASKVSMGNQRKKTDKMSQTGEGTHCEEDKDSWNRKC